MAARTNYLIKSLKVTDNEADQKVGTVFEIPAARRLRSQRVGKCPNGTVWLFAAMFNR